MKIHETYIKRCIQLAKNGLPAAMPNPSVGAVLVHNGSIISEGYTSAYGGAHAEVHCINNAKNKTPEHIPDSTLYVTLEPCSHFGKTPPCADLIVASGIKRVVIGTVDPHAKVAGNGIKKLLEAGVDTTVGILESECFEVNKRFFTFHNKKRPYIILKWAQTQDHFIAPASKQDQAPVWITNRQSRQLVHKWRSEEQAILIGAATAIADNPSLTTRDWNGASPLRIVLNPRKDLPEDLAVYDASTETLDIASIIPSEICEILYNKNIQSVIIEGGAKTLQRFIDANLWDEARVFMGPVRFQEGVQAPVLKKASLQDTILLNEDILTIYKNTFS